MRLTYTKPTSMISWVLAYGVFGPLIGAIQVSIYWWVNTFHFSPITILFAVIYSYGFIVPALLTGSALFFLKDLIINLTRIIFFSFTGAILTYIWLWLLLNKAMKHGSFEFLTITIAYVTTIFLTSLFFYKVKTAV